MILQRLSFCSLKNTVPDLSKIIRFTFSSSNNVYFYGLFCLAAGTRRWLGTALQAILEDILFNGSNSTAVNLTTAVGIGISRRISSILRILYRGTHAPETENGQVSAEEVTEQTRSEQTGTEQTRTEILPEQPPNTVSQILERSSKAPIPRQTGPIVRRNIIALSRLITATLLTPVDTFYLRWVAHQYYPLAPNSRLGLLPVSCVPWNGQRNVGSWAGQLGLSLAIRFLIDRSFFKWQY
jgi:hypothetical protein